MVTNEDWKKVYLQGELVPRNDALLVDSELERRLPPLLYL